MTTSFRFRKLGLAALSALAFACVAGTATAQPLDTREQARLGRGETIVRNETLERGDHRYVGGVTYTVVDATAADLDALFADVASWKKVLPLTKAARIVGREDGDVFVELTQGNALVSADYTIRVRRTGAEVRFWLDPSRPHQIDDAWGFFRMEAFTAEGGEAKVLLTYGILVDVGPGLVRDLFEERVRTAMLSVPQRLRHHVDQLKRVAAASRP